MWPGWRLTKGQTSARPDHVWPEVWSNIGKAAQNREKQEWKNEKPKLDNARRLTGVFFVGPDDQGHKETLKNARRNIGKAHGSSHAVQEESSNHHHEGGCKQESHKRSPKRSMVVQWNLMNPHGNEWKNLQSQNRKIALQVKVSLQLPITIVHTFLPMPQAMKIPDANAAVDKEWEKLEKIPAWNLTKVRSKSEVIDETRKKGAKVHFASLMDLCHLENSEFEPQYQSTKAESYSKVTL